MGKYLYGASIQGIQGFIFETNKLKEIVGASDLIEWFCKIDFIKEFAEKNNFEIQEESIMRNAGGNIRIIFSHRDELSKMVKNFPKDIMQQAYGITISQAVVEFKEKEYLKKKDELEHKLTKARNQATIPLDARFALMKQTQRTGKPAFESEIYDKGTQKERTEYFDKGNWQKRENREEAQFILLKKMKQSSSDFTKFPSEIDKITNNNKIAIIHADGNSMGLILQRINNKLKEKDDDIVQKFFKDFSNAITKSTNNAVTEAFNKNFIDFFDTNNIPFRPIVIGGDDVTVICNPNLALEFTKDYLEAFERNTKNNFTSLVQKFDLEEDLKNLKNGLTACAGISFCNSKFPFHYAYDLAEHLCSYAKKESGREASCLAFHNIQSSFVEDYKTYIKQELTTKEGIKLLFAPYFIKQEPKIETLIELHELFSDSDIPLGKYREWLSELHKNKEYAELFLERVDSVLESKIGEKYIKIEKVLQKLDNKFQLNCLIINRFNHNELSKKFKKLIWNKKYKQLTLRDWQYQYNEFTKGVNKTPMQDILQLKSVIGSKS